MILLDHIAKSVRTIIGVMLLITAAEVSYDIQYSTITIPNLFYLLECSCHFLGRNETAGYCDRFTGQCPCLPNVRGKDCDSCVENTWKIASGYGCELCDCDPIGSEYEQCDEVAFI